MHDGSKVGDLGVAFAFGLTLLAMAYASGPISGCHINPAVTLGFVAVGRISVRDAAGYIIGQVIGAMIAAAVLYGIADPIPGGYDAGKLGSAPTATDRGHPPTTTCPVCS